MKAATKKDLTQIPVSERAVLARLQRHLAKKGLLLKRYAEGDKTRYAFIDAKTMQITDWNEKSTLESLSRQYQVLKRYEKIANWQQQSFLVRGTSPLVMSSSKVWGKCGR
jgi:hypothetical protein